MDVNKLKPYMFWIVCGVILVAQLVYFGLFLAPSQPPANPELRGLQPPADAQVARRQAETRLRDLDALKRRAEATLSTPPQTQVLDPAQADRLRQFIVSDRWEPLLRRQVEERQRGVASIRQELSSRSQSIHEPVSIQTDPVAWYAEYQTLSAALVRHLVEEGVLQLPASIAAGTVTAETYRTNAELRGSIGLETAHGRENIFEDPQRRLQASRNFRLTERVTRQLAAVRATPLPHPRAQGFEEVPGPSEARPRIQSLSLARVGQGTQPAAYNIRVQLVAIPAVLMESGRALDSLVEPIGIRLGSRWQRRDFGPRDKHGVADVPMTYETQLLVLDFFDPNQATN